MSRVLIIDDDAALCRSLQLQLQAEGHVVEFKINGMGGFTAATSRPHDLVLLDLKLPDGSGIDLLHRLRETKPNLPVVLITGHQDMKATIEAMRSGAFDYIRKPFGLDEVLLAIEKAAQFSARLRSAPAATQEAGAAASGMSGADARHEIIGSDRKIVEVVKQIGLLSRSRVTVLIEGESGTGKELVARALHEAEGNGEPFVAINCSAVVATLFESELFGHEKGAFTGADARKIGKLEHAGEGTIFFDEIGDMPLELQAKMLRVLQEREFERVGGLERIAFGARAIAATNVSLEQLVADGRFRQDLYYRLAVSRIALPPLRERRGDIPALVSWLIARIGTSLHRRIEGVEEQAMWRLQAYDWPGNVRELENVLTRAAALAKGNVLGVEDLEFSFGGKTGGMEFAPGSRIVSLQQAEKEHIRKTLIANGWNISHTAEQLEISPTTLRKKIAELELKEE